MTDPIRGSLELITNPGQMDATSDGMTVEAVTVELVPTLVAAVYGIADLTPADPENTQIAAWTGTDSRLRPIRCVLWPEPPPYVPQEEPQ